MGSIEKDAWSRLGPGMTPYVFCRTPAADATGRNSVVLTDQNVEIGMKEKT